MPNSSSKDDKPTQEEIEAFKAFQEARDNWLRNGGREALKETSTRAREMVETTIKRQNGNQQ